MNMQHTSTFEVKHSLLLFCLVYIFQCVLVLVYMFRFGCNSFMSVIFFQSIQYKAYSGHLAEIFRDVGLGGCRIKVIAAKNLGLVLGVFCSLPLSLFSSLTWTSSSSSSSQSDDIENYFGHVFPSGVYIAQYLECSINIYRSFR